MGNVILITNKVHVLMESNFEPIPKIRGQLAFIGVKPQIVCPDTRYISFG